MESLDSTKNKGCDGERLGDAITMKKVWPGVPIPLRA
jgi:hypothetical protein